MLPATTTFRSISSSRRGLSGSSGFVSLQFGHDFNALCDVHTSNVLSVQNKVNWQRVGLLYDLSKSNSFTGSTYTGGCSGMVKSKPCIACAVFDNNNNASIRNIMMIVVRLNFLR